MSVDFCFEITFKIRKEGGYPLFMNFEYLLPLYNFMRTGRYAVAKQVVLMLYEEVKNCIFNFSCKVIEQGSLITKE